LKIFLTILILLICIIFLIFIAAFVVCYFNNINKKINQLENKFNNIFDYVKNSPCRSNIYKDFILQNIPFRFYDSIWSCTSEIVAREINENPEYNFDNKNFEKGDLVIDIGGNIGMISIFLAKKYPFLKIYSFEPLRQNYKNFMKNIKANNIPEGTIIVENKAITKDSRNVNIEINYNNTGASRIISDNILTENVSNISSLTLNQIIEKYKIKKIKLLKIDCEGSEYEILFNASPQTLRSVEYLCGEFHNIENDNTQNNPETLLDYCEKYIKPENILVNII